MIIISPIQTAEIPSYEIPKWEVQAFDRLDKKLGIERDICWGDPTKRGNWERAVQTHQLIWKASLPDDASKFSLSDFAFIQFSLDRSKKELEAMNFKVEPLYKTLKISYKTTLGYTPTIELTNTPDHHWAKISLDNLYRNHILVGDPAP